MPCTLRMVSRSDALPPQADDFLRANPTLRLNGSHPPGVALWSTSGVAILSQDGEELTLQQWASLEESEWPLMDAVVAEANARGCTRVRAEFVATGANPE